MANGDWGTEVRFSRWAQLCFAVGALGVMGAGVLLSVTSWMAHDTDWAKYGPISAVVAMVIGLVFVTSGGYSVMQRSPKHAGSAYTPFIFGLGVLMCGVGGTGIVGVAGLIHARQLERPMASEQVVRELDSDEVKERENDAVMRESEEKRARFVLLAGAMAFVGSLFYIALALWRKQHSEKHREEFDVGKLISGAALRCGEAELFVLVFVLLTQVGASIEFDGWLPVMGLMLGMFVKSGERLVFNLATRIFDLAESVVPSVKATPEEDAEEKPESAAPHLHVDPLPDEEAAASTEEEETETHDEGTNGSTEPRPAERPLSVPPPS